MESELEVMNDNQPARKLPVDLDELAYIFDANETELTWYLDLETGQILLITDETRYQLESIIDQYGDEDGQIDLETALAELDLSATEQQELRAAYQIETAFGERYIRVPAGEQRQGYKDMADFIDTVQDARLKIRLQQAINKRGAFRNFKDALATYPSERERWFAFKNARAQQRVLTWLEDEGIEIEPSGLDEL